MIYCNRKHCLYFQESEKIKRNDFSVFSGRCEKETIFINESGECISFSNIFRGHRDFSNLPKGGHLSDEDAVKLKKDNEVSKSFPDHTRQEI